VFLGGVLVKPGDPSRQMLEDSQELDTAEQAGGGGDAGSLGKGAGETKRKSSPAILGSRRKFKIFGF
jgi:hypothetical protein